MKASTMLFTFYDWLIADSSLPKGSGLYCPTHIVLIFILFGWIVASFFIFKKYKNFAFKLTKFLCWFMVISRIFRMCLLFFTKTNTLVEVLPWHLCHLMAFIFPLFYLTKTKKFFLPILCVTFFGGILTFVFGDYYQYSIFTFLDIESILLHFMMVTVVTSCVATGYFEIKLKETWQIPIILVLLIAHASLGNYFCKDQNFLFLRENGLPFNLFPGHSHLYTYIILVLFLTTITIVPLLIIQYFKNKHKYKYYVIG